MDRDRHLLRTSGHMLDSDRHRRLCRALYFDEFVHEFWFMPNSVSTGWETIWDSERSPSDIVARAFEYGTPGVSKLNIVRTPLKKVKTVSRPSLSAFASDLQRPRWSI